ncbi:MAG: DUF4242 domain-containing protein [Flavobacteriales bacterium]|nr:MAG: DUF4242 domain-containing protein [Flavobacteriales bacterium]
MPLYMDRHDIPDDIKAEHVALMHQEDLKVQHLYGCKGMTYWCDSERHTAFCLIEAPNKEALQQMHNHAHGAMPHQIIEVDAQLVESFLGRIEDPVKAENEILNIIDEPAFRIIMVLETNNYLNRLDANQLGIFNQKFHKSVLKCMKKHDGSIAKRDNCTYLASFKSVTNAVMCALKIQSNLKYVTPKFDPNIRRLNIGLSAGTPVTDKEGIFSDVISIATCMCEVVKDPLVISHLVKTLYENENHNTRIDSQLIRTLNPQEEDFLAQLMAFTEKAFNQPNFNLNVLSTELGLSKSQLYRKLTHLTGISPNQFIREFRLKRALRLLHDQFGNISEIAFETGLNSPAYFSKCFLDKFVILPSRYMQLY